jgi:hypothetical protein
VAFSCKSRFCPTCGKKATDQWIATQRTVLPQTSWQHITFTMPSQLWALFELNRELLGQLSPLAAKTVQKAARKKGLLPGLFTALHTFGRDIKWHVHIHLSVTLGGLTEDQSAWKALYFHKRVIMPMWRYEIINLLRQRYQQGQLVLPAQWSEHEATPTAFNGWLDKHYRKAWHVHFTKPSKDPNHTVNYLGRYLKRPPLSQSRLAHYDGQTVVFNFLNHATGQHQSMTQEAQTFIARFVRHIPDKGFRMIRYYGFLAHRVRGQCLPIVYALLDQTLPKPVTVRWPSLLERSFGLDPLRCILCQSPLRLAGFVRGLSTSQLLPYHSRLAQAKLIP